MPGEVFFNDSSAVPLTRRFATDRTFPQQGSIDWVALIKSTCTGLVEALKRVSSAGVDPYTVVVAQALCRNFKLGPTGQNRIIEILSNLKCYNSLGQVLWFGFGVQDITRMLATTDHGAICLALSAALLECYHEDIAAEIWVEISHIGKAPEDAKPSLLQWKALLSSCAGVLASTSFSTLAETYMQYYTSTSHSGLPALRNERQNARSCSSPESIAAALCAIGRVSRGELTSITVTGGSDAGWLAAFAEYFLDISIKVLNAQGDIVHSNHRFDGSIQPQLTLIYQEKDAIESARLRMLTSEHTFRLSNVRDIFSQETGDYNFPIVSGRVTWDKSLSSVFGSRFDKLMTVSIAFGAAIGNAARIYKAIASAEEAISLKLRMRCTKYCSASYGVGFIDNIVKWFPELAALKSSIRSGYDLPFSQAKADYEMNLSSIMTICGCYSCQNKCINHDSLYCCALIMQTILRMGRSLSTMTVHQAISPTRIGLEYFYDKTASLVFQSYREEDKLGLSELGRIYFTVFDELTCGTTQMWEAPQSLLDAILLFSGRDIEDIASPISAISRNGICVYLHILHEISDADEFVNCVFVVPGRIECHGKQYTLLKDMVTSEDLDDPSFDHELHANYDDLSLIAKAKAQGLAVGFQLEDLEQRQSRTKLIGPARLNNALVKSRGLVACKRVRCPKISTAHDIENLSPQCQRLILQGMRAITILHQNLLSRCVSLYSIDRGSEGYRVILVDRECNNCSLRTVIDMNCQEGGKKIEAIIFAPMSRNPWR